MRTRIVHRFATLLLLVTVFLPPCFSAEADVEPGSPAQLASRIILDMQNITAVPAFSVAVVKNGSLVWDESTGYININEQIAADKESIFRLASVSKAITATLIAYLVQEGQLNVNAPVSNYLKNLPAGYQDITVLQLLTHTSGLPHYQLRDAAITETHYSSATSAMTAVGDRKLLNVPGEAYHYSSHGYTLLGALFEAVTGKNFDLGLDQFRAVFTGRATPAVENVEEPMPHRSHVYDLGPDGAVEPSLQDKSYTWTGGGLEATAVDLALWGDAVMHSAILSDSTRAMMFSPHRFPDGSSPGTYLYSVAFGWRVGTDGFGRRVVHHAGVTQGARSVIVLYPEEGLSIAILSNASWTAQIERTAFGFANLFLSDAHSLPIEGTGAVSGRFGDVDLAVKNYPGIDPSFSMLEENGVLSDWLNRFDPLERQRKSWPLYKLKTSTGSQMIMVGTIGLINLRQISSEDGVALYRGSLGKSRELELRLSR